MSRIIQMKPFMPIASCTWRPGESLVSLQPSIIDPRLAEAVSQSETEGSIGTEAAPSRPTNDSPRQREREDGSELPLLSDGIGDMTNPIIRVSHLTYRYPSAKRAVIDDLSFTIARGETVALMGVNGSGKSTLVRMLCALTAPTAGSIEVAGVPVASTGKRGRNVRPKSANRKQLAQLRRHVGYVMQHPEHQLFADTVAEDVAYGPRNQGLGETEVADACANHWNCCISGILPTAPPSTCPAGNNDWQPLPACWLAILTCSSWTSRPRV